MPTLHQTEFIEATVGEIQYHRLDFSIEDHDFVMIFSDVEISDVEYLQMRSEEVGFSIPERCYDVKFDRLENFDSGDFYAPPPPDAIFSKLGYQGLMRLGKAFSEIIGLHYQLYDAKAYFAMAETRKLKSFYDRILQQPNVGVPYEIIINLGEMRRGYAIKTPSF
ncbi:hypothetical protein [Photorhabdus stackebrandtii]|uniref:Uncharacterized protein n=1 Tax=Photorhabdus stackebrandtii TaxID=1123042 RepID=A0A7X5QQR5_9GAMM|nr:hypothetical protein [Photorhabdus stackebrandtii]NHB98813.1 hypothetical protein [Photorhabdus stackebrandtii]